MHLKEALALGNGNIGEEIKKQREDLGARTGSKERYIHDLNVATAEILNDRWNRRISVEYVELNDRLNLLDAMIEEQQGIEDNMRADLPPYGGHTSEVHEMMIERGRLIAARPRQIAERQLVVGERANTAAWAIAGVGAIGIGITAGGMCSAM